MPRHYVKMFLWINSHTWAIDQINLNHLGLVDDIDGLVQERRNFSALAMELRLSCTKSSI